jgi:bifunctional DNA-binding transcriptional regulator/antitoxin component of YhaV-PrlF toxin-antitoxin module
MEKQKIIKIKAGMADPKGVLIPRGIREQITIEIADEVATYYFKDQRITKNFVTIEIEGDKANKIPQRTFFRERIGKAIRKYPGMKKEEIRNLILEQLKQLGAKIK